VADIMTQHVITIDQNAPIEDDDKLMGTRKIGGLPVVNSNNQVVGVITETDIFKAFAEMLGSGEKGVRLTIKVPSGSGTLARLSQAIYEAGGLIISVGSLDKESAKERELIIKVRGVTKDKIVKVLEDLGDHVIDAREV
jgi:acetoin utilization protein AcuB